MGDRFLRGAKKCKKVQKSAENAEGRQWRCVRTASEDTGVF
jgi:hypothetical protein